MSAGDSRFERIVAGAWTVFDPQGKCSWERLRVSMPDLAKAHRRGGARVLLEARDFTDDPAILAWLDGLLAEASADATPPPADPETLPP